MTDQELIARLLSDETDLTDCAADRIKELGRSRKDLEKLSIKLLNEKLQGEWREPFITELEAAEAKLTKAVEALRETDQAIMLHTDETSWRIWGEVAVSDIRKVLAELEVKEEATGTAWRGRND